MSLKSIRESYSKLLTAFEDAGVKLSKSQKSDLDTFVLALESNMEKQRKVAVHMTRKLVEAKMQREYKKAFESLMESMHENAELAAKIQTKIAKINETKRVSSKVNEYLDLYVESVLPKKTVVDYDRMRRLEKIHESLRTALAMSDETIQEQAKKLDKKFKLKESQCETEVAKMQVRLNESMKKVRMLKRKLEESKIQQLIESKTASLPSYEARRVKKALAGATSEQEVERNYRRVLESVKKEEDEEASKMESTVESEVKKIINGGDIEEDDMLKDRPHNLHKKSVNEKEEDEIGEDDMLKNRNHNLHKSVDEDDECGEDDAFETVETFEYDQDGDVQLDESDVIDADLMRTWCMQSMTVD